MGETVRKEQFGRMLLKIVYDDNCVCPFDEWCWPSTLTIRLLEKEIIGDNGPPLETFIKWLENGPDELLCPHRTCHGCEEYEDCDKRESLEEIDKFTEEYHWLPVYKYEHGNVVFNTTGFSFPWDNGIVGYIAISKEEFSKEFHESVSPDQYLATTIQLLSDWANGNCYGFVIEDSDGNVQDSCWGYYGEKGIEAAIEDAKEVITG